MRSYRSRLAPLPQHHRHWPAGCWSSGSLITLVFVVLAVFAPVDRADRLRPVQGRRREAARSWPPPSRDYWFGTNDQFYDVLSRVIWGARTALIVVVLSVLFSVVIGVPLGLVSGYVGGWTDRMLVFVTDALYAFPTLLLAIVFSFLLSDRSAAASSRPPLSLTVIYIPQYFRVVRNTTVSAREATYVEAARAIGAQQHHDHGALPLRQRDPVGARHRHAQRR